MSDVPRVEVMNDLPSAERSQTRFWRLVMEQVMENPDQWCKVPGDHDPSTATHIRQGKNSQIDPTKVQVATRYEPPEPGRTRRRVTIFLKVK